MFQSSIREGIATGELIAAEWLQIVMAALGGNIVYFMSSPVWRLLLPYEPWRRCAEDTKGVVVEFLGKRFSWTGHAARSCGEGAGRYADAGVCGI